MPVMAPVPTDAIRRGRLSEAPDVVTRTGRIACTPWPGRSFSARKSKPSVTYAARIGWTAAGMLYPFCVSQLSSALPLVERSWTVAYGPTFCETSTCTGGGAVSGTGLATPPAPLAKLALPKAQLGEGQFSGGGLMTVSVSDPTGSRSTSALSPTWTGPLIGNTHAKFDGDPEYWIWS